MFRSASVLGGISLVVSASAQTRPEGSPHFAEPFSSTPASLYGTSRVGGTPALGAPGLPDQVGSSLSQATALASGTRPRTAPTALQWGPFDILPHADYRLTYGNGLNARPGVRENTFHHLISPGVTAVAPHLRLDYTPSLNYYSSSKFKDTTDHRASLAAGITHGDWRFGLSHLFQTSSSPIIETATQTDRTIHSTGLSATYRYSEKLSFDLTASQQIQDSKGLNSSRSWSTMNWVDYHFTDTLFAGLGAGFGYVDVDLGSDMTYEQIQGRLGWRPGPKLSIFLNGGLEIRQFIDAPVEDRLNPLVGLTASYAPWQHTRFTADIDRSVESSLLANQITEATEVTLGVSQRLLGRLNFRLAGGIRSTEYQSTAAGLAVNRSDDYSFIRTSLGTSWLRRGTVSVFYQHGNNETGANGFSFTTDQYGLQIGYRF